MKEYELINPSDPYTFEAEDLETAALVVFGLSTTYGAKPKGGGQEVPIFIFGGAAEWYKQTFNRGFDEALHDIGTLDKLSRALSSMMLGDFETRERYNAALEAIDDPEKKANFIAKWQDGRSSLNDIGGTAHALARAIEQTVSETRASESRP